MEYLTNEKLLKQQPMFSLNNSRSNSVSRFLVPSQRNTHDPTQPMRSTDLFNRLDDILKSKQINTTTRKKSKQTSCIINPQTSKNDNSKEEYQRLLNNIENTNLKLPFEPTPFLNYTDSKLQKHQNQIYLQQESCLRKKSSIQYLQDTDNKKRENLKKFKQEFISMQEKIKSRNNSVVDFKVKDDSEKERISLKKLNQQLQEQNNNLQDQLLFEKGQNEKLNSLMNNLNDQVQMLNKQLGEQQLSSNQDNKEKDNLIIRYPPKHKKTLEQVKELTKQNIMFQEIQQGMHELENLCGAMENIGQHVTSHNQLVFELRDLFKIQNNIIDKIVNRKDFPIEQLIAPKKNFKNQQPLSEQVIETTTQLQQLKAQIKKQIDLLTERFIQDLLI